jgi:hypothetical protein
MRLRMIQASRNASISRWRRSTLSGAYFSSSNRSRMFSATSATRPVPFGGISRISLPRNTVEMGVTQDDLRRGQIFHVDQAALGLQCLDDVFGDPAPL